MERFNNYFSKTERDILSNILYDGLHNYCKRIWNATTDEIEDCTECPARNVCRVIIDILSFLNHH